MELFVHITLQSMPEDRCDRTCAYLHASKIPNASEKLPVSASLSTVHMPSANFFVANTAPENVTFCFHYSAVSSFILNEIRNMLQKQETVFRMHKSWNARAIPNNESNCSCRLGARAN